MKIGILAIQGSVIEHIRALKRLGVDVIEIRIPSDLKNINGLILPGGESTTQSKLMRRFGLFDGLKRLINRGLPVWGTCAGAILLAKKVLGKNPPLNFESMDIIVDRNAYGNQLNSFETDLKIKINNKNIQFPGIFIRAPKLDSKSNSVKFLSINKDNPVMLRQKNMLATSFHPELTDDLRVHEYFVEMCR